MQSMYTQRRVSTELILLEKSLALVYETKQQ